MAIPSASPIAMPTAAIAITSTSMIENTRPPVAPSDFSVAIAGRFRATKPRIALATPAPPMISAVSPTRVRNWVKRRRSRENCGDTFSRVRTCQPASGNALFAASTKPSTVLISAGRPGAVAGNETL